MRVIAGTAKGLTLRVPRGDRVRPTADRVKESLFGMLGDVVLDADVLDLFAGSGSLGIEALSRGAASATFVDRRAECIDVVRHNLKRARLIDRAELIRGDALRVMPKLSATGRTFHVIFADPPYEAGMAGAVVDAVGRMDVLEPGGYLVIEHGIREEITYTGEKLEAVRIRAYGDTVITMYAAQGTKEGTGESRALSRKL